MLFWSQLRAVKGGIPGALAVLTLPYMGLCMIKIFRGGRAGVVTPSDTPPPTNNFCLYPPPVFRCFWKDPLMTPYPHHLTSRILHCYPPPHPPPLPPLKILIVHLLKTRWTWGGAPPLTRLFLIVKA